MAVDIRIQGSLNLGSLGGFTTGGVSKNNKTLNWGDLDITTYTAGGEPVTAGDLGLATTDVVLLSVRDVDDTLPSATNVHVVTYDYSAEQVLAWDGADAVTIPGASAQVKFLAIGDAHTADLT